MYKKIDNGIEYVIYQISQDTVLKVPHSFFGIVLTHIDWHRELLLKPIELFRRSFHIYKLREKSFKYIVDTNIPRSHFGNFRITKKGIEQDYVTVLKGMLNQKPENAQKYINEYISLLFELWKYGCSDIHFNLTLNTGVTQDDSVTFIDLGELCFEKAELQEYIKNQQWLKGYSYNYEMSEKSQKIFKQEMHKKVTLEILEKYWGEYIK